jgi:hypothetical protein
MRENAASRALGGSWFRSHKLLHYEAAAGKRCGFRSSAESPGTTRDALPSPPPYRYEEGRESGFVPVSSDSVHKESEKPPFAEWIMW